MLKGKGCRSISIIIVFFIVIIIIASTFGQQSMVKQTPSEKIDGVYEFVSEQVDYIKPRKYSAKITTPEWEGLWIFKEGYYSFNSVKPNRNDDWYKQYPISRSEFGYDSAAGTYSIVGDTIMLREHINMDKYMKYRPINYKYVINDKELVLTNHSLPIIERMTEEIVEIRLRRIK
jgi:hypothetical protein